LLFRLARRSSERRRKYQVNMAIMTISACNKKTGRELTRAKGDFKSIKAAIKFILSPFGSDKPTNYVYYINTGDKEKCYTCSESFNIHKVY